VELQILDLELLVQRTRSSHGAGPYGDVSLSEARDRADPHRVASLEGLGRIYAEPLPAIATKETDHITGVGRDFIASPPFLILATSNGDTIDCSPKDDAPGFVQLLDYRTLLIPDWPGNNRIDDYSHCSVYLHGLGARDPPEL
jgi:hypothetical protein